MAQIWCDRSNHNWINCIFCMIKNFNKVNSSVIKRLFVVLWGIVCIIPIIMSLFKSGVECDSAYYICMAERITEGYTPYVDLCVSYTPLWFYIEATLKSVFQISNGLYWPYLLLFYVFSLATAYVFYRFLRCINTSPIVSYFAAGLFLLITHWLNGNCVLLEIPFMFWGMMACWLSLEWRNNSSWFYILVGVFCACSFLSKQFGLGFLVLGMYATIFIAKRDFKTVLMYIIGYILPIVICYLFFGKEFLSSTILQNGYGTVAAVDAGYDISFIAKSRQYLEGLKFYLIYVCPIVVVSFLFLYNLWKQGRIANIIFAYCGILGFALQFFFASSEHYMIPLVPFGIITATEILSIKNNKYLQLVKGIAIVCLVCIALYKTYNNRVYKLYIKRDIRTEQQIFTNEIKKYVSNDDVLYIVHGGLYYLYFTADILPPNISTVGYSFGPMGLNTEQCINQIKSADYVIRYSADYPYESYFTDSVKCLLETYPLITQFGDSTILLHRIR